jgi:hypothetical protein
MPRNQLTIAAVLLGLQRFNEHAEAEDDAFCGSELTFCDDGSGNLILNRNHDGEYESLILFTFGSAEEVVAFMDAKPLARAVILAREEADWYPAAGIRRAILSEREREQPQPVETPEKSAKTKTEEEPS